MMLLLRANIMQQLLELTRTYRNGAIPALPEKAAITSIKCLDPLRGYLLCLLDQLSLGNNSRQRRDNMDMVCNTADAHQFGTQISADCRKKRVHPWSYVQTKPRLAILRAKNDVNDDLT